MIGNDVLATRIQCQKFASGNFVVPFPAGLGLSNRLPEGSNLLLKIWIPDLLPQ